MNQGLRIFMNKALKKSTDQNDSPSICQNSKLVPVRNLPSSPEEKKDFLPTPELPWVTKERE